jgi:hypothetical protein
MRKDGANGDPGVRIRKRHVDHARSLHYLQLVGNNRCTHELFHL